MYFQISHHPRVELRYKLPEKLHCVTGSFGVKFANLLWSSNVYSWIRKPGFKMNLWLLALLNLGAYVPAYKLNFWISQPIWELHNAFQNLAVKNLQLYWWVSLNTSTMQYFNFKLIVAESEQISLNCLYVLPHIRSILMKNIYSIR